MSDRYILIELYGRTPSQPAMFDSLKQARDGMARRFLKTLGHPYEGHTFNTAKAYLDEKGTPGLYGLDAEASVNGKPVSWRIFDRYPMPDAWLGHAITEEEERSLRLGDVAVFRDCRRKDGTRCTMEVRYGRREDGTYGLEPAYGRLPDGDAGGKEEGSYA